MRKSLKICSPQLGLDPKSDLGGEVHDHFAVKHLAERGHKIFVYLPKGRTYKKHKNIVIKRAPIKHIPAPLFNLMVIPYLFKTYKKEKFDILRVHNPYFVGPGALIFKFFHPKVPIITTHHLKETGFLFNLINSTTLRFYDGQVAVSNYIKNWLINRYNLPEDSVKVIYNGVDSSIKPQKKDPNLVKEYNLNNKTVLLFAGLLIERKNPMFTLKIFKKLKKNHLELALLITGKGPLRSKIKKYIVQNNLKDAHLTGKITNKNGHFNLADIFILPSKNEGFGLVIGEAMACKNPVVITNAWSANEAITDGKEGYLAKENNLKDWEKKIEALISNKRLREKMGKAAVQKVKTKFSWKKVIVEYENLFQQLLDK